MTFGQYIAERRKDERLTQRDLAARLNLSVSKLNDLENDRSDPRNITLLQQIASELHLDVQALTELADAYVRNALERRAIERQEYATVMAFRLSRE